MNNYLSNSIKRYADDLQKENDDLRGIIRELITVHESGDITAWSRCVMDRAKHLLKTDEESFDAECDMCK